MNATPISRSELIADNAGDSDSDTNSDEIPDYYEPISSIDGNDNGDANNSNINGYHHHQQHNAVNQQTNILTNGYDYSATATVENGVGSLNLSEEEDEEERESEEEEEEEEEEETRREEMDSAMRRAFEEDESRRNAPLSAENATRVMEAMRGVSFTGAAPDWIRRVPEDNWIRQLQRLRQPPHSAA